MAEVLWYYARNDQQFGPVTANELKQLVEAGRLSPDDLLWREGMDAWTTAVNLRGLFSTDPALAPTKSGAMAVPTSSQRSAEAFPTPQSAASASLVSMLRATQGVLWIMCVLVVLAGVILFTKAILAAREPEQETAAAAVFATFLIGAYVLARCGEKLSKLLLAVAQRRRE